MKDKISVPGPAKAMYGTYIGALILVLYTGFNLLSPFLSGWRYPWSNELAAVFNFYMCWILVLTAIVYLYYSTLGRPDGWNEPLGIFRIFLVLLTVWFGLLTYAVYQPNSWMRWLVGLLGGVVGTLVWYQLFLWIVLLANVIYLYVRWAKSSRFPKLTAPKLEK